MDKIYINIFIIQSKVLPIKNKTNNSKHVIYQLHSMQLQCQAVTKVCSSQDCCCEERCEIQSGSQEMAVMVG